MTGVADANLDGAPLVAITGQVGTDRILKPIIPGSSGDVCAGNQMECPDCPTEQYTRNCASI